MQNMHLHIFKIMSYNVGAIVVSETDFTSDYDNPSVRQA